MKKILLVTGILTIIAITLTGCSLFSGVDNTTGEAGIQVSDGGENAEEENIDLDENDEEGTDSNNNDDNGSGQKGQYFVSAILKSIDQDNNMIVVEQLINDPDENIIEPDVMLSPEYKVVRSDLNIEESEEKYTDIKLEEIPLGSEIGIMFGGDDKAELIIYQVIIDIDDEEILGNTVLGFLEAVKSDEEYDYFSSSTISMVGTEEQYTNGDNSDIYFIIKESHSSWENISISEVRINGDLAEVDIVGDRMAEGTRYEGETVTFRLINEQGTWKIDFST